MKTFFVFGLVILFLLVPFLIRWGFGRLAVTDIPGYYMEDKRSVVCTYRTYTYGMLMLICFGMGITIFALVFHLFSEAEYIIAYMFFLVSLCFIALGIVFILFMKNWVVVFHSEGIIYRNLLGKIYQCTDEEVLGCAIIYAPRRHSIHIRTKEKNIWLNIYCTNYHQAKTAIQKYQ